MFQSLIVAAMAMQYTLQTCKAEDKKGLLRISVAFYLRFLF